MGADTKYYALNQQAGVAQSGTITLSTPTNAVTGSGTAFLTGHHVGDTIVANGEEHTIASITSNTVMTIAGVAAATASGLSYVLYDMSATLQSQGVPFPKSIYEPYSQMLDLGDGGLRGGGWPVAEWHWGFLTRAQRQTLRGLLPVSGTPALGNPSGLVRLRTAINENNDAFITFKGQMLWPHPEPKDTQRRPNFVLKFRALVDLS